MIARSILTLMLIILAAAPLAAEGGIGLGPQIGIYNRTEDSDGVNVIGGVALRVKFSEVLGVEGSISYRKEEYADDFVSATGWPVMVTGLIYPIPIVYGAIGVGWYNTTFEYTPPPGFLGGPTMFTTETKQQFGWHFGGGLELPLGSIVSLVGDVRYVFLDYDFENVPGSSELKNDFYVLTAGLLFGL